MTQAVTMKTIERKLQKAGRKHARLYLFCNFTALMIISAYSALMFSPTVQTAFPAGGRQPQTDERDFCDDIVWLCGIYFVCIESFFQA